MANAARHSGTGTAETWARPGNDALGSPQSRAAARASLERRFAGREKLSIILSIETFPDCTEPRIGEWRELADGKLVRTCILPAGMTIEEAEGVVAQPEWKSSAGLLA